MSTTSSGSQESRARVLAYLDGFNIYYGLRNACEDSDRSHIRYGGDPSDCIGRMLYWLNLESVVLSQLKRSEHCLGIKYFSAPRGVPRLARVVDPQRYIESNKRQSTYLDALTTLPLVQIVLGWYSENQPHKCAECGAEWPNFEEKVTDVNIATHLLRDAYEDRFDKAYVLSADADLVPPVRAVRDLGKEVVVGLFPGRKRAKHLRSEASEIRGISIKTLRTRRLPEQIDREGLPTIVCPARWRKPNGWVWRSTIPTVG